MPGLPAAKMGDQIVALDVHIILIPAPPAPPIPTPIPHPFNGIINGNVSPTVMIGGAPAAVVGSIATNTPPHIPQGGPFSVPPTNIGVIISGSTSVLIGGLPAARAGDPATTCNDIGVVGGGKVIAVGMVLIGG